VLAFSIKTISVTCVYRVVVSIIGGGK